jgi:hypothetical protein
MPMTCPNCFHEVEGDQEFCPNCGAFVHSKHDYQDESKQELKKGLDGCAIGCLIVLALLTAFMAGCGLFAAFQPPDEYGFNQIAMVVGAIGLIGLIAIGFYVRSLRKKK